MTAQETVAADALREAGYTEDQVTRMLAAARPLFARLRAQRRDLEETGRSAARQMQSAQLRHAGEMHTEHCWARLAWGDGECECIAAAGSWGG